MLAVSLKQGAATAAGQNQPKVKPPVQVSTGVCGGLDQASVNPTDVNSRCDDAPSINHRYFFTKILDTHSHRALSCSVLILHQ